MATIVSMIGSSFCYSESRVDRRPRPGAAAPVKPMRRMVAVRAAGLGINPDIRKDEAKVVDSVEIAELAKPLTAYCRCWRSGTFPLCDGSHVKHNKETGDNVGPLLLKKQKE